MKGKISSYLILICMMLCFFQCRSQSAEQKYTIIADTIINNIIKLEPKYAQLEGIANNDQFKSITKQDNHTTIRFHFLDKRAKGLKNDYYLIMDLNFYICKKPGCIATAEKELSIGNMQIEVDIDGKGNDELNNDIIAIIKKAKADYESKQEK